MGIEWYYDEQRLGGEALVVGTREEEVGFASGD